MPELLGALKGEDVEGRMEAIAALGDIGDEAAVPGLAALLAEEDLNLRREVMEALAKIGGAAVEPLVGVLASGHDSYDATLALERAVATVDDRMVLRRCARSPWWFLTDRDEDVAAAAFRALKQTVGRLAALEVESLPGVDMVKGGTPDRGGTSGGELTLSLQKHTRAGTA